MARDANGENPGADGYWRASVPPEAATVAEVSAENAVGCGPAAPPVRIRVQRYGCRATVSFGFLSDQNSGKFCQNARKIVRIHQKL